MDYKGDDRVDDDILAFFIIMGIALIVLVVGVALYAQSTEVGVNKPKIMILATSDLNVKQELIQPIIMPGTVSKKEIGYILYIYNPQNYNQTVNVTSLFREPSELTSSSNSMWFNFYCSAGNSFLVMPSQIIECHVTAVLVDATPKDVVEIFDRAGSGVVLVDVSAEVTE